MLLAAVTAVTHATGARTIASSLRLAYGLRRYVYGLLLRASCRRSRRFQRESAVSGVGMAEWAAGELLAVEWSEGARAARLEALLNSADDHTLAITFDGPGAAHPLVGCSARVAPELVQPLPDAPSSCVPPWSMAGREVVALREASPPQQWQLATVVAVKQGLRPGWEGCRIRVRPRCTLDARNRAL